MRYIPGRRPDRVERERPQSSRGVRIRVASCHRCTARSRPSRRRAGRSDLQRAGRLGILHERKVLAAYQDQFGDGVVEIPEARSSDAEALSDAVRRTNEALASDAEVIYQAAFATKEFVGFADFLVREPSKAPGAPRPWIVQDTKLARHARVTALMQLAAYVDQLDRLGVCRADHVELLLGDGTSARTRSTTFCRCSGSAASDWRRSSPIAGADLGSEGRCARVGDPRGELGIVACGRCATCDAEVVASRDLLLVAGMRPVQREKLRAAGILTIDALAVAEAAPATMNPDTFAMLRTQARLQLESPAGTPPLNPPRHTPVPERSKGRRSRRTEVVAPKTLIALPRPRRGDLFFDFEGDPLHTSRRGPQDAIMGARLPVRLGG